MKPTIPTLGVLASLAFQALAAADAKPSILTNGDFEAGPGEWPMPAGASCEQEGNNHFLRLDPTVAGQTITVYRQIPLNGATALQFSYRVRTTDVKRGSEPWHDARIILEFKDAAGVGVKPAPAHPYFTGTTAGWQERTVRLEVPAGAVTFAIMPAMFQAEGGAFDLDDLTVVPITADEPNK